MKKFLLFFTFLFAFNIFFSFHISLSEEERYEALNYENVKAIWISQFDMEEIYMENGKQRKEKEFRKYVERILDEVKEIGINTIFYQVRPYSDSMYPSKYFPPCSMVTGSYSKNHSYDVLEIIIEEAHEKELSVHAWINPMRGMKEEEIGNVSDKYLIKQWYNDEDKKGKYIVLVSGRWYLNVAYEEVRELIVKGVTEILEKYDADGLHMDDYFYPTTSVFFDFTAYSESGKFYSLSDFRKHNLSLLIKEIYKTTRTVGKGQIFGISPTGEYKTATEDHYADVDLWCTADGYIDYICPQIYFGFEHPEYNFASTAYKWNSYIKNENVKLIIGLTLEKAKEGMDRYAETGVYEWSQHKDILFRSIQHSSSLPSYSGFSLFSLQFLFDPLNGEEVKETKEEVKNLFS